MIRDRNNYNVNYYNRNKNKYREYYQKNKERIIEKAKQYYKDNLELKQLYNQIYYENNKNDILKNAHIHNEQYYQKNKSRIAEYYREYYLQNKQGYRFEIKVIKIQDEYKPDNKLTVSFD
jgi:hypothetical protein